MNDEPSGGSGVPSAESFQLRVQPWLEACFGAQIAVDKVERNDRFIEEALELVQACGGEAVRCHALVDYVFGRPAGDPGQEVGGVMNTLAALCLAHGMDMNQAAEVELARVWTKVEAIRAKQKAKPTGSALPVAMASESSQVATLEMVRAGVLEEAAQIVLARAAAILELGRNEQDAAVIALHRAAREIRALAPHGQQFPRSPAEAVYA